MYDVTRETFVCDVRLSSSGRTTKPLPPASVVTRAAYHPLMTPESGEVTILLQQLRGGNRTVEPQLIALVYTELRRLASLYMRNERQGHTLQPTALVHEAYMRLTREQDVSWRSRAHFIGIAATVMRRILVDHSRARRAAKRGGGAYVQQLPEETAAYERQEEELIGLDRALDALAAQDQRLAQVVEMRYFGGLMVGEIAEVLGVSDRTIKRDWTFAKAWLRAEMTGVKDDGV